LNRDNGPISVPTGAAAQKLSRGEVKNAAIVEAARVVFLRHGFDGASMDRIAAKAGVSKRTVYFHFQSKENLFAKVMLAMCASKRPEVVGGESLEISTVLAPSRPIDQALRELGENFLTMIFDPEAMALLRILIGQANQFPEIGQEFFDQGPRVMVEMLTQYLIKAQERGVITLHGDAELAAGSFLTSLLGPIYIQCLATASPPPGTALIKQRTEIAVKLFLRGTLTAAVAVGAE
jgi:TetR/AcrR family transcriptional repressor of mexJK operon